MNEHPVSDRRSGFARLATWLCAAGALTGVVTSLLHAQISEEDKKKRDAFLKAREEMHTIPSATPGKSASPAAKPKPAKKKGKSGKSASVEKEEVESTKAPAVKKPSPSDEDEADETPASKGKKPSPTETPAATPSKPNRGEDESTPRPKPTIAPSARPDDSTPPPRTAVTPIPSSTPPAGEQPPADITIHKSGYEAEQGYEPPPPPPPRRGFLARLFRGGGTARPSRYLTRAVIEAIRGAPVQRSRWKFIIVHNSGTRQGNARAFDYYHRNVRHMQNGMAYHFVVGNGTSSGDGQIEIGSRWRRQINGGHVHSDYLNNISLGICLVGDFNRSQPTHAQLDATEELIQYLRDRCGKVDGRAMPVRPHREMNPPRWATDCPGDAFPYSWFRRF
ncbi:MAG: N-acetylmuramoyl-L-alanine amidase [Chthoniobacterales bacterium]|nr:N-acetylmuramoyl-L-alanine amidase [Chthoniobacterales bacterium]